MLPTRQSLRVAIKASLQDVPATELQRGTRVRVLCDRFKLYPGAISEVREVDGCRLFTVAYDDGEVHNDVKEDELRLDTVEPCSPTHKHASGKWMASIFSHVPGCPECSVLRRAGRSSAHGAHGGIADARRSARRSLVGLGA